MYNPTVMDHFENPRNVGQIPDADSIGEVGSLSCGDILRVYIKIEEGKLVNIKYQTFGCAAAVASGSMLTELALGKTVDEALELTNDHVEKALQGLPPKKKHCSNLAADALQQALLNWQNKKNIS